jgi:hypothetical protein
MCISQQWSFKTLILAAVVAFLLLEGYNVFGYDRKVKMGKYSTLQQSLDFTMPSYLVAPAIVARCLRPFVFPITILALAVNLFSGVTPDWMNYCFPFVVFNIFDMFMWEGLISDLDHMDEQNEDEAKPKYSALLQVLIPFFVLRFTTGGSDEGHASGIIAAMIVVPLILHQGWLPPSPAKTLRRPWAADERGIDITKTTFLPVMIMIDNMRAMGWTKPTITTTTATVLSATPIATPATPTATPRKAPPATTDDELPKDPIAAELSPVGSPVRVINLQALLSEIKDLVKFYGCTLEDIERAFRDMDRDNSGTVDKDEFKQAMKNLGIPMGQSEVEAVFDFYDDDHNGTLDINEFQTLFTGGESVDKSDESAPEASVEDHVSAVAESKGEGGGASAVDTAGIGFVGTSVVNTGAVVEAAVSVDDAVDGAVVDVAVVDAAVDGADVDDVDAAVDAAVSVDGAAIKTGSNDGVAESKTEEVSPSPTSRVVTAEPEQGEVGGVKPDE